MPAGAGTSIYSDINGLLCPQESVMIGELFLFPGNYQEAVSHANKWLCQKRGVLCSKAGAVASEYNLRFWHDQVQEFPDRFLRAMAHNYVNVFRQ